MVKMGFLLFGLLVDLYRCQGYIKARMKSEEKRRTRFHSGHGTVHNVFLLFCVCVFLNCIFASDCVHWFSH